MKDELNLRETGPIALAFVGDSVFDLFVRKRLVCSGVGRPKDLQRKASGYARAESQAAMIRYLFEELTEEEQDVVRRARNARQTPTKNADPAQYHRATGLEALMGWLYLRGREARMKELMEMALPDGEAPEGDKNASG